MPAKKEKKTEATKEVILNGAEEIFALDGYSGARTASIAKKADVNKALIHYYFTNKETLYHAVMDRMLFEMVEIVQGVLKKGLKGKKLINGLLDALFDYAAKHRHFAKLTSVKNAGPQSYYLENTLKNFYKPLFERAVEFLERESKNKKIAKVDARHFIITMYLALHTYFSETEIMEVLIGNATSRKELDSRKKALRHFVHKILEI